MIDAEDYGAFPGVDCTGPLTKALAAARATRQAVVLNGRYLTDTLPWAGQPIVGHGPATGLVGMPGRDVLRADPAGGRYASEGAYFRDFTVTVDDSTTGGRGFVCDDIGGTSFIDVEFRNVRIRSKSGTAKNGSVGFAMVAPLFLCSLQHVRFDSLDYGLWESWPANVAEVEVAGDHNVFANLRFRNCGDAFRLVNTNGSTLSDIVIHTPLRSGLSMVGVASLSRSRCYGNSIQDLFIEGAGGTPIDLSGVDRLEVGVATITGAKQPIELAGREVRFRRLVAVRDGSLTPLLRTSGTNVRVDALTARNVEAAVVEDTGQGSEVWLRQVFSQGYVAPANLTA